VKVHVTYIDSEGASRTIEAAPGASVMEAAIDNEIPEVESECGGVCTCAACHVYVDPAWLDRFGPMSKAETGLLSLQGERRPNSRLSCQLKITEAVEGLVVRTLATGPSEF
jgi:ferredoxin, 2Fe-2S